LTDFWLRLDVFLRLAMMRSCVGIGFQSVKGAVVAQRNSFFTVCAFSPTFAMAMAISVMDLPKCLDQRRAASPHLNQPYCDQVYIDLLSKLFPPATVISYSTGARLV
jgi:hypothetical protein